MTRPLDLAGLRRTADHAKENPDETADEYLFRYAASPDVVATDYLCTSPADVDEMLAVRDRIATLRKIAGQEGK